MNWFKKLRATIEEAPLYREPILLLTEKQYIDVLENFYGRKLTKKELQKVSIKIEYQIKKEDEKFKAAMNPKGAL